jgi:Glycosyltransferase family 87
VAVRAIQKWCIARRSSWLLALALVISCASLWALLPLANSLQDNTGHDFRLLFVAATALRAHQNPYDTATFLHQAQLDNVPARLLILRGQFIQPYVYPPVFAWLIIPLTFITVAHALLAWRLLSLACVFAGTLGLIGPLTELQGAAFLRSRLNRVLVAALVTFSPLAFYVTYWGNPVVISYAAMGGSVWALNRHHPRADLLAGALMVGALLKPQFTVPIALLATFCFTSGADAWARRKRVALSLGVTVALLLALDIAVTGAALLRAWVHSVRYLSSMIYLQPDMPTLIGMLRPLLLQHPGRVQQVALYLAMALGAGTAIWLYRRLRRAWAPGALFGLLTVVWCFASPYAHANDDLLLVPGGLALMAVLPSMVERFLGAASFKTYAERLITAAQVILCPLALVLLWRGGVIGFDLSAPLDPTIPTLVYILAPVAELIAFGISGPLFAQSTPNHLLQTSGSSLYAGDVTTAAAVRGNGTSYP